jgi:methylated-DNA-[protein]-cysteine S-methyltransferase
MKVTASFYSEFLARFILVVLEDEVVQHVELEPHSRHNNLQDAKPAVKALERYLRGENVDLSVFPVNLENRSAFERATLQYARQIPRGGVVTYSELAAKLGNPQAARAVGNALRRNPVPLFVPCHRVVGVADLGGYTWGLETKLETKRKLLQLEGVHSRGKE